MGIICLRSDDLFDLPSFRFAFDCGSHDMKGIQVASFSKAPFWKIREKGESWVRSSLSQYVQHQSTKGMWEKSFWVWSDFVGLLVSVLQSKSLVSVLTSAIF